MSEVVRAFETGAWTIRLMDGSALQLSWEFERELVVKHRYAFIPWPFQTDDDDDAWIEQVGLTDWLDSGIREVAEQVRVGGAFRVDFDQVAAKPGHPTTHLTLFGPTTGLQQGRLPVSRPWSVGHFARFVFGTVSPPTRVSGGRVGLHDEAIKDLAGSVALRDQIPTITNEEKSGAWLAWGRAG